MKLPFFFVLSLLGSTAFGTSKISSQIYERPLVIEGRAISQSLYIDNPYHDAGEWGPIDVCEDGSFANAVEVNYQEPNNLDETAINAIKLYCSTTSGHSTGYVTSSTGNKGEDFGMYVCTEDFITGFRANVLEYQGIFTDDVAVQDFEVDCNYGQEIMDPLPIPVPPELLAEPANFKPGEWSSFAVCQDGLAVCGIQTRYEDGSLGDEAAIVDAVLFCCDRTE